MPLPRLVLYPGCNSDTKIDVERIKKSLLDIGLIESHINEGMAYLPGKNFLQLLTFLGCSPNINLHPDEGENYCHIYFGELSKDPLCLGHTSSAKPKCPQCKTVIQDWKKNSLWQDGTSLIQCEKCGAENTLNKLKWRREAGYGIFSIMIYNIHPHEAVPAEQLLLQLEKVTAASWDYCYANNSE
ncbi:MAG: hypothetical protein OEY43_09415 [Gammaproteobacteria bacterium]|nr:hypothetical protein [Gammaproteobacteria bacterium]